MKPAASNRRYRGCFTPVKHSWLRSVPCVPGVPISAIWSLALTLATVGAAPAFAQVTDSDSQLFEVYVPPRLTGRVAIQGPVDIRIFHDGTDDDQTFADQRWDVGCNNLQGATVTFTSRTAFRLTGGGPPVERDARLELGILSSDAPAGWVVTVPTATTNYRGPPAASRVSVAAESFAPGDAVFNLRVHFITEDFATLRQGDYNMRVEGTITAK